MKQAAERERQADMSFNPMKLAQLKPMWGRFKKEHADFLENAKTAGSRHLQQGTTVTLTLTSPDGSSDSAEMKLSASDLQMVATIREMFGY